MAKQVDRGDETQVHNHAQQKRDPNRGQLISVQTNRAAKFFDDRADFARLGRPMIRVKQFRFGELRSEKQNRHADVIHKWCRPLTTNQPTSDDLTL